MKRFSFFIVFGILIYCYLGISMNYQEKFKVLEDKLDNKTAVLLDNSMDPLVLAQIMVNNSYVPTQPDADFIAQFLKGILQTEEPPQAIMELAKRDWQIPAGDISPSTPSLMKRLEETRHQTGWNEYMDTLYCQQLPSVTEVGEGDGADMTVKVKNPVPMKGLPKWKQQWLKAMKRTDTPAEGVLVRLCRVSKGEGTHSLATPIAYAMTDTEGSVTFKGLAPDSSYSVLPIQKDMTFGAEKGTRLGNWGAQMEKEETVYEFLSYPLKLRVLTSQNLVAMRDGGLVVVRTPENFKKQLTNRFICFMGVWLLLFIIGNVGKLRMDNLLAAVLMLISGLGMMLMFGFNDPMTQRVLGDEMSIGYIIGVIFMVAAMCMDFKRFFQNYYWVPFDFTMRCWDGVVWVARHIGLVWCFRKAGNGLYRLIKPVLNPAINPNPQTRGEKVKAFLCRRWRGLVECLAALPAWIGSIPAKGYFFLAVFFMVALVLFGEEVGGMKVNLNLIIPFQPSEIVKYLLIFFMSAFFFEKADAIVRFSQQQPGQGGLLTALKARFQMMGPLLFVMAVMVGFYMFFQDMGPALVVSLTFITLYSLVKSRLLEEKMDESDFLHELLHSDFAMLVIGVLTFIACLLLGNSINGKEGMKLLAFVWLGGWCLYGWLTKKQFYETAFMFNLIITLFIFGPDILAKMNFEDIATRLAERNSMCYNTWGSVEEGTPTINMQVVEGLWALATGGLWGMGLGNALAHYIPAGHTDMVIQSIGEVYGFFGVLVVFLLLSIILRRTLLAGYRSHHPFLLYLCFGIALTTGVQLLIIAGGSMGIIPLTGIVTPLLSYGRVSLILNSMAFGIILSISARAQQKRHKTVKQYNDTVAVLSIVYAALIVLIMVYVAYYQIGAGRDKTLNRPVYVYDTHGAAVLKYNPRIQHLMSKMNPGNIYDRNKVLLATSDTKMLLDTTQLNNFKACGLKDMKALASKSQRRYYPFGEHLFFMVGDFNNKFYFPTVDQIPYGYLAEARHMSLMRGYENRSKDDTVTLKSDKYKRHRFLPEEKMPETTQQVYNYEVLLPFLKAGHNSELVNDYNNGSDTHVRSNLPNKNGKYTSVKPQDIQLTVDARLQVGLQNGIPAYFKNPDADFADGKYRPNYKITADKYRRYERFSIVVMDAESGDLLASAMWPLPDYDRIAEADGKYTDAYRPSDWTSYTERDLGLTRPTNPGSTAKLISAMAGIMHVEQTGKGSVNDYKYTVREKERIHLGSSPEPSGKVGMKKAIEESSNIYFINLVNDLGLYDELAEIYGHAGMKVNKKDAYGYGLYPAGTEIPEKFFQEVTENADVARDRYNAYKNYLKDGGEPHKLNKGGEHPHGHDNWFWAWGEGTLEATPVAMARIAALAATGSMPQTRFCMDTDESRQLMQIEAKKDLKDLRSYMKTVARSIKHSDVYGKTGTPEESFRNDSIRMENYKKHKAEALKNGKKPLPIEKISDATSKNDGWFVCYIDSTQTPMVNAEGVKTFTPGKLAVAVRIERTFAGGSGYAKDVVKRVVIPALREAGYFPPKTEKKGKKK